MDSKENIEEYIRVNDPDFHEFIESMQDENGNIPLTLDNISNLNRLDFINGAFNDFLPVNMRINTGKMSVKDSCGSTINYDFNNITKSWE